MEQPAGVLETAVLFLKVPYPRKPWLTGSVSPSNEGLHRARRRAADAHQTPFLGQLLSFSADSSQLPPSPETPLTCLARRVICPSPWHLQPVVDPRRATKGRLPGREGSAGRQGCILTSQAPTLAPRHRPPLFRSPESVPSANPMAPTPVSAPASRGAFSDELLQNDN